MGWKLVDGSHRGWMGCVAPDGRLSVASSGAGMSVIGFSGRTADDGLKQDVVPDGRIVGWRGVCSCGWQGLLWERVIVSVAADISRRRDYAPLDGWADPSPAVQVSIRDEWFNHAVVDHTNGPAQAVALE